MIIQPCPGCAATNQVQLERIHQLERELAEAQSESAQLLRNYAQLERHHNEHHDADGALQSELAEVRKDAERYRWLANKVLACDYGDNLTRGQQVGWRICGDYRDGKVVMFGPSIDAAIDAAR